MWLANLLFQSVRRLQRENEALRAEAMSAVQLPPAELRERVGGTPDAGTFLRVGATLTQDILALLQEHKRFPLGKVLDFGCGCGRVARWFPFNNIYGCDVDQEAVRWCSANLNGHFTHIDPMPTLPYEDSQFDNIIALSVFTHLNEEMVDAWLGELARVSKAGAILIASVHGAKAFEHSAESCALVAAHRTVLAATGFAFAPVGQKNMPDYYRQSYHLPGYISDRWSKHFEVVSHREQWIHHHQDAIVLRRR